MTGLTDALITRRRYLQTTTLASVGLSLGSFRGFGGNNVTKPLKREMGRLHFAATTLGLGGQASLQWTPADVDPSRIILKAFALGVNYFDTSNVYGPSQANYGKAFHELHLIPGEPGYNESLRRSIFLTTKTGLRWAKGGWTKPGLANFTNGPRGSHTVDDIRRSLSLMFGDGQGAYPKGAWLDMVLLHSIAEMPDVDAVYEGLRNPDPRAENIGALAALVDYRDGSNLTGLNPKGEKLVRHIGFSGHHSPPVMMEMIQRDEHDILDGMLVAINANDRLHFNMQYNVIPLAAARNMGLIAMKTFADGAMYTKPSRFSNKPEDVVRTVGSAALASRPLVEYTLSTPGIHTLIIGTGQIDDDARACQLQQNLAAAQIMPGGLSVSDRRAIEKMTASVKDGKTNYFQLPGQALTAPREASAEQQMRDGKRIVRLTWQTAYAGDEPLARYEIWRDHQKIGQVTHQPQVSRTPFLFEDAVGDKAAHTYSIATVDAAGRSAASGDLPIQTA
ncbi:MAG: aldo/keto reductase [Bryobacteraceae bacterium]|jgi:aryl-alcohol dehydrogenase-like predicted oxidoreductase